MLLIIDSVSFSENLLLNPGSVFQAIASIFLKHTPKSWVRLTIVGVLQCRKLGNIKIYPGLNVRTEPRCISSKQFKGVTVLISELEIWFSGGLLEHGNKYLVP